MSLLLLCALLRRVRNPLRVSVSPQSAGVATWRIGFDRLLHPALLQAATSIIEQRTIRICRGSASRAAEALLATCRLLSFPFALVHAISVICRLQKLPPRLARCRSKLLATLIDVWATRFLREAATFLLRTPFRRGMLALVDDAKLGNLPSGCVIAVCHSPWFRWLAEWCKDRGGIHVVAGADWVVRAHGVNVLGGYKNVRALVMHLQRGGRVVVIGDVFGTTNGCALRFLGESQQTSVLPARLAALAGVPLVGLVPECLGQSLRLTPGPTILVTRTNQLSVMRSLLALYEAEIRHRPASWGRIGKRADQG